MIGPKIPMRALAAVLIAAPPVRAQTASHFLAKQCNEDAIAVRVDARPFQELVRGEFTPVLEEGRARVLVVVHDCSQYWMDGENVGPTQETQVWLAVRGIEDVRPVVGAERTLPTRTWLSLFSGSTNARVRAAKTAAGLVQRPIRGVSLDPPAPRRGGRLLLSGELEYRWQVASAAPAARLVGINHDVYSRDSTGTVALNRIQVVVHVTAGPSPGTLEVTGDAAALPWLPSGRYPATVQTFFPMWSRATLGLPVPR